MDKFKKLLLIFIILTSCLPAKSQMVTMMNGNFKLGDDDFYPMVMNYQSFLIGFNGDYFVSPHPNYGSNTNTFIDLYECNDDLSCSTQMQNDFNYISSLGFNCIRVEASATYSRGRYEISLCKF